MIRDEEQEDNGFHMAVSPIASSHTLCSLSLGGGNLVLADIKTGASIWELQGTEPFSVSLRLTSGHRDDVYCTQWSPVQEHVLVSGSKDKTVRLWDIRKYFHLLNFFSYQGLDRASKSTASTLFRGKASRRASGLDTWV